MEAYRKITIVLVIILMISSFRFCRALQQKRLISPLITTNRLISTSMKHTNIDISDERTQKSGSTTYRIVTEGRYTRYVNPYFNDFNTFAKGRWLGREVLEVFCREFGAHPRSYWINAVKNGQIRVNGEKVQHDYKFKNGDALRHRAHRHEPPVFGEIITIEETQDILAVCKPPSMPMHPCGAYRHNSLEFILKAERNVSRSPSSSSLHIVHRLDRVTSGLVIIAKSKEVAANIAQQIRDKNTTKIYLARVKGKFPTRAADLPYLRELEEPINLEEFNREVDEHQYLDAATSTVAISVNQKKRSFEGDTGVSNDNNNNSPTGTKAKRPNKNSRKNQVYGRGEDINVEDLPPLDKPIMSKEEVGRADNVGFVFVGRPPSSQVSSSATMDINRSHNNIDSENDIKTAKEEGKEELVMNLDSSIRNDQREREGQVGEQAVASEAAAETSVVSVPAAGGIRDDGRMHQELWLRCPLAVVSQRNGRHACDPSGKPSLSMFRCLGYCAVTNTSLVECRPYTGRTHQLRLHLELLGTPIANDPCYGGELFYGDSERRQRAIDALMEMKAKGLTPLSKVPHIGVPELDAAVHGSSNNTTTTTTTTTSSSTSSSIGANLAEEGKEEQRDEEAALSIASMVPGESEDDYLVRTCRYCTEGKKSEELEDLLHCDGIWLHALRYSNASSTSISTSASVSAFSRTDTDSDALGNWSFQTPLPDWAEPFLPLG